MRWRRVLPGGSVAWDLIEVEAYNIDNWGRALAWCDGKLMTVPYRVALEQVLDGEGGVKFFKAEGGHWHPDPNRHGAVDREVRAPAFDID